MKFPNIKKDDIVFAILTVRSGGSWHGNVVGKFSVPVKVTWVTPKFFDVGKKRYSKLNGEEYGGIAKVFNEGDYDPLFGRITNQIEEYREAKLKASKIGRALSLSDQYSFDPAKWSNEDLDTLINLLEKNKRA